MWIEEVLETFYNSKLFQLNRKHLNLIYQFSHCHFSYWVYTTLWVQTISTDRSVADVVDPAVEHGLAPGNHRNVPTPSTQPLVIAKVILITLIKRDHRSSLIFKGVSKISRNTIFREGMHVHKTITNRRLGFRQMSLKPPANEDY